MEAISPGELLFPDFGRCLQSGLSVSDLRRQGMASYVGVDLSSDSRPGVSFVALGLQPQTLRRAVLGVRYGRWSSPETASQLVTFCEEVGNVQFIQVENNAYQQSLIDWIKQEKQRHPIWMKVEPFTTGSNKANPHYGLPAIEVEFKNGGWLIPYSEWEGHPPGCTCDWDRWATEFKLYPKGGTTDGVMASWFARDALNKWGKTTWGGPRLRVSNVR